MEPGAQGDGTGAMTGLPEGMLGESAVPSHRDKSRHSDERGLDSRNIQTEQYHDHVGARQGDVDAGGGAASETANTNGSSGPMTDGSGEQSSLRKQGGCAGGGGDVRPLPRPAGLAAGRPRRLDGPHQGGAA